MRTGVVTLSPTEVVSRRCTVVGMGRTRRDDLALARLISGRLRELGMSYQDAATQGGVSKSAVAKLATRPISRVPRVQTLLALSTALRLPVLAVQAAASESVGLAKEEPAPSGDQVTTAIIALVPRLSAEDRGTVLRMVEGLLAQGVRSR